MNRAWLLLLAVVSELGIFLLWANDPLDMASAGEILDFGHLHHATWILLLGVISAVAYFMYWRSGKKAKPGEAGQYAA